MEHFSFDDMFKQTGTPKSSLQEGLQSPPSEELNGVRAIAMPDVRSMSKEQLLDVIQQNMATMLMQEAILNSLLDLLIEKDLITENEMQKSFNSFIDNAAKHSRE